MTVTMNYFDAIAAWHGRRAAAHVSEGFPKTFLAARSWSVVNADCEINASCSGCGLRFEMV